METGGGGRRVAVLRRLVVWCRLGTEGGRWREDIDMNESERTAGGMEIILTPWSTAQATLLASWLDTHQAGRQCTLSRFRADLADSGLIRSMA